MKEKLLARVPVSLLFAVKKKLNDPEINWVEYGKEFYLKAELYDVAFIKVINGYTIIYCINDEGEEKLLNGFGKAIESGSRENANGKSSNGAHVIQLSEFTPVVLEDFQYTITIPLYEYGMIDSYLPSSFKPVSAPPPRSC